MYRSELADIYAILLSLKHITHFHNITDGTITISCNNKAALYNLTYNTPNYYNKHHDLINAITQLHTDLPISVNAHHTHGHQDEHKHTLQLTHWEIKNIEMDELATQVHINTFHLPRQTYIGIHSKVPQVCMRTMFFTNHIKQQLIQHIQGRRMLAYLIQQEQLTHDTIVLVDWKEIGLSMHNTTDNNKIWIIKWITEECGTSKTMNKCKHCDTAKFPYCSHDENTHHVMQCRHHSAQATFNRTIIDIQQWLKHNQAPTQMITSITLQIRYFQQTNNTHYTQQYPTLPCVT